MAVDALEYDEVRLIFLLRESPFTFFFFFGFILFQTGDESNPSAAVEDILVTPEKLGDLDLDAFAEELERQVWVCVFGGIVCVSNNSI